MLIITIPTTPHERLHRRIYTYFTLRKVAATGTIDDWSEIGSATLRKRGHPGGDGGGGGDGGEADSSGGPSPLRSGPDDWPTLVIEAGDSQTLEELHRDMNWWFSASDHQVKIVLLAKLERSQRKITIEKWTEVPAPARQGATTTRAAAAAAAMGTPMLRPRKDQTITIIQVPGSPPSYNVDSRPLVLEFQHLFLQQPGPGQEDIIITIPELQAYARDVWRAVR